MPYVLLWLFCAVLAAVIASNKGRSEAGWFVLGLLVGPFALVGGLLPSVDVQAHAEARVFSQSDDDKKCPSRAEVIRVEAVKCRYCQSDVPSMTAPLAVDASGNHPLTTLTHQGRTEAERYFKTLALRGYASSKLPTTWEITTSAGRVVSVVSTLEELRDMVQSIPS